jgi:hypothetical protein
MGKSGVESKTIIEFLEYLVEWAKEYHRLFFDFFREPFPSSEEKKNDIDEKATKEMVDKVDKVKQTRIDAVDASKKTNSFAGLLWFGDAYDCIAEIKGKVAFTRTNVADKLTVLPEGAHSTYKAHRFACPRGRVELNAGIPTITVGTKCPDSMIDLIIKGMELGRYKKIIKVRRNSFWDKK